MPRTTKKPTTPIEKHTIPTVPTAEQPYKVPENWRWVRLSQIIDVQKEKTENFSDDSIRYIGLENMEKDVGIVSYGCASDIKSRKNVFKAGNILYGKLRPYLNKHGIAPFDGICSTDILVLNTKNNAINNYVNYYFNLQYFIEYAVSNSKGINLPRVSADIIMNATIPLPPLAEQRRIVDRIERLFAKLDEAREKAQAVVDGFENRKAAVLHQAFTGELTRKWREERGIGMEGWNVNILKDCCDIGSGGTPSRKTPEYYNGKIPWVKTGEICWNEIYDTEEHISDSALNNSSAKLYQPGVVLVAMYGMGITRGRAAILRNCAATNQAVCVLSPHNNLLNIYLYYYFMCNYWLIREQAVGGNQLNLSGTIIEGFKIYIPPLQEQTEIVRILDSMLDKEQRARDLAESVIAQIDGMKKAILARAFRGELGTNVPEEAACEG